MSRVDPEQYTYEWNYKVGDILLYKTTNGGNNASVGWIFDSLFMNAGEYKMEVQVTSKNEKSNSELLASGYNNFTLTGMYTYLICSLCGLYTLFLLSFIDFPCG